MLKTFALPGANLYKTDLYLYIGNLYQVVERGLIPSRIDDMQVMRPDDLPYELHSVAHNLIPKSHVYAAALDISR
jgi:hypothetical protein